MLSMEMVRKVAKVLRQQNLDACLFGSTTDLEYLSGLNMFVCERFKGLFILADERAFCVVPKIYLEEFKSGMPEEIPLYEWEDHTWFYPAVVQAFRDHGLEGKTLGVNDGVRAVDAVELINRHKVRLVNAENLLGEMRSIKNSEEVELLRKAGSIADAALKDLLPFIVPGKTERDIAKRLIELMEAHGAQGLSFPPLVARGPHAAMPHYAGNDGIIQEHDTVLLDFGCRYRGYCSDMTRTLFVGEPTEEEKTLYDLVRLSQQTGEDAVRPGVSAQDVDRAARKVLEDAGYGAYFNNRLGHGIGVAVHENPYIVEGNETPLAPGMTFSVEPGIYIPGKIGIRIENIVVVTENGCEALNRFPRDYVLAGKAL